MRVLTGVLVAVLTAVSVWAGGVSVARIDAVASAAPINGNQLYFDNPTPPAQWYIINPVDGTGPQIIDPANYLVVPGDVLEMRSTVILRATGPATGRLTVDASGITPDNALRQAMTVATTTSLANGTVLADSASTVVTQDDANQPIDVRVRVTFDLATQNRVGQSMSVDLGNTTLRVEGDDTPPTPIPPIIPIPIPIPIPWPGPGQPPGNPGQPQNPNPGQPGGPNGQQGGPNGNGQNGNGQNGNGQNGNGQNQALPQRDLQGRSPLTSVPAGPTS